MVNVLIVDDSGITRKMVRRALGMSGLPLGEIFEAENGKIALELLETCWVDVVFADIHMPVMTGTELVERMAKDALLDRIPVVIVSTDRSEEGSARLRALGVRDYLTKPFRPEALLQVVSRHLSLEVPHAP